MRFDPLHDRRAIAVQVRKRATDSGRAFAFHFFLRYGDYTDPAIARECALARQFFDLAASEALAPHGGLGEDDRQLLIQYALAAVEVAFNERLHALARENAAMADSAAGLRMEWRRDAPALEAAAPGSVAVGAPA